MVASLRAGDILLQQMLLLGQQLLLLDGTVPHQKIEDQADDWEKDDHHHPGQRLCGMLVLGDDIDQHTGQGKAQQDRK